MKNVSRKFFSFVFKVIITTMTIYYGSTYLESSRPIQVYLPVQLTPVNVLKKMKYPFVVYVFSLSFVAFRYLIFITGMVGMYRMFCVRRSFMFPAQVKPNRSLYVCCTNSLQPFWLFSLAIIFDFQN